MRFRMLVFWITSMWLVETIQAQDPNFSQFYAAPLYLNPALAGVEKDVTFSANFRSQWRSLGFPQQIGQFSGIFPLHNRRYPVIQSGGIGFSIYNDLSGEGNNFRTTGIQAGAAYNLVLSRDYAHIVSFGMQIGMIQKAIDFTDLRWGSQYNAAAPFFGFDYTVAPSITTNLMRDKALYPVVHSGVVWHFNPDRVHYSRPFSSFIGFSVSNLNRPDESLIRGESSQLPLLFRMQGGFNYELSPSFKIMPNILWMRQNGNNQINAGTYFSYEMTSSETQSPAQIMAGAWYRIQDSFILSAAISNSKYTLGFSYDINTSSLRYTSRGRGAWELSLTYRIIKNKAARRFSTPLL
ncbi:PorP/SprF family type IX secretion system membrane protein [Xanthocytophaga agilis]|uniref:PorP/SprF family type IX secretion system membrane protein n=1 Tax=Xanthocytophaga agilis TaxID=3048010 RepID=A0AAE3UG49_9BACT|nr:PorP/SprF family type IX secretion system membrane protein [Xanthocytophaga agilis]MDJ1504538.1 PorP/SprF family type IX secretion system membrane protein [Xanthocytophaga agilis]